jgi:MoxR-like ATPase
VSDAQAQLDAFAADRKRLGDELATVLVGLDSVIDDILSCLLTGSHALIEGNPGLGKTLLVRTLATAGGLDSKRIQFTPDLMPADITGTNLYDANSGAFRFQQGPLFSHLVLADEINRATPKTQSAILEAMSERTVSIANTSHPLPEPFCVFATQNPIELEGTYPLPEAQLDRFGLKILVPSPTPDAIAEILRRTTSSETPTPQAILTPQRILELQQFVREIQAASNILDTVAQLVDSLHPASANASDNTKRFVRFGPSPRGAQAILLAAKYRAACDARPCVAMRDVHAAAPAALRHRLVLNFEAHAKRFAPDALITEALAALGAL